MVPTRKANCTGLKVEKDLRPLSASTLTKVQDHLVEGVLRFGHSVPVIMSLCYKHFLNASVS